MTMKPVIPGGKGKSLAAELHVMSTSGHRAHNPGPSMGEKVSILYTGAIITDHTNANQWRLAS